MTGENPFRFALLLLLAASLAIGLFHRLKAGTGERLDRRGEGLILVPLRLAGLALGLATIGYLIRPGWAAWASLPLPRPVRWAGAAFGVLGIGLMFWTLSRLGRNLTDTVATRRDHTLVTSGPYRYVRHPYYVTTLLLVTSAFLLSADLLIGGLGLLVFALLAVRTPAEERELAARFGSEYARYRERTGRFLPRLR